MLYTLFYEFTTSFNIHDQIDGNNTAVGVALAGNLVAIGIVVLKAVFGDFVNWEEAPGVREPALSLSKVCPSDSSPPPLPWGNRTES